MSKLNETELKKVNGGMSDQELIDKYRGDLVGRMLNKNDVNKKFFINGIDYFYGVFKLIGFKTKDCKTGIFTYALSDNRVPTDWQLEFGNVGKDIYWAKNV